MKPKPPFEEDDNVESLEVTARTVSEAIEKALQRLGKSREEVDVSVLSEGSRGILGIGGEDARILVSPRELDGPPAPRAPAVPTPPAVEVPAAVTAETAQEVLEMLLAGMHISAEVEQKATPATASSEGFQALLDISGVEDVGVLIGRRGETLGALQFLTSLITSKKTGKWAKILVDVEGYRMRRETSLRSLAVRMAQRVQQTRQPMALEAMPPNERRIVHLALQDHPAVKTASIGEGEQRHIVISPKR
jgi:spoIIIJ-associated protein